MEAVPWHHLYSFWAWLAFCASLALGTPLTPLSSYAATLFATTAATGLWRVGVATADVSLRTMVAVWEITAAAVYLLRFPRLRRVAWWRLPASYVGDAVMGAAYLVWLHANGTDPWTVYTKALPPSVDGKTVQDMAHVRWPLFVVPPLIVAVLALAKKAAS